MQYPVVLGDVYISELMVETNARVNSQDILSILSTTTSLQVNSTDGIIYTVTLLQNELVAGTMWSTFFLLWLLL